MKHQRIVLFLGLLITSTFSLFAFENSSVGVNIRYYDKRVYYIEDDPIWVEVTISNGTPETYRFKLADDRIFSVDFDVRTLRNRNVDIAERVIQKRTQNLPVFFREVSIEPGESFSFIEDLRDYAMLEQSGSYVVQAKLYPELLQDSQRQPLVLSNRLSLNLRNTPISGPDGIPLQLDVETNAILARENLPPDEVIDYLLTARQKSQWEKFFVYLDLEAMIMNDAGRKRIWLAESEEGRQRMLARYRLDLQNANIDGEFSTIPLEFDIERTSYGGEEGTVTVLEKFKTGNYIENKRYTYHLLRRDDVWMIVDYTVLNLGTE
jgi:hypothetical protein